MWKEIPGYDKTKGRGPWIDDFPCRREKKNISKVCKIIRNAVGFDNLPLRMSLNTLVRTDPVRKCHQFKCRKI